MNDDTAVLGFRVERAEAFSNELYANAWAEADPGAGVATHKSAGALSVYAGADSPLTQVLGLGVLGAPFMVGTQTRPGEDGSPGGVALREIEDFFFSRGAAVQISLSPLVGSGWLNTLARRGYVIVGFETVVVASVEQTAAEEERDQRVEVEVEDSTVSVELRAVEPAEVDRWAEVTAQGFLAPSRPDAGAVQLAGLPSRIEGSHCFGAFADGEMAAGAALLKARDTWLFLNDSTLPRFRNKGLHAALIARRLARVAAGGGGWAAAGVAPGSVSERNYLRAGFRTLYTKATVRKDPES
jgi:hypothetical protein